MRALHLSLPIDGDFLTISQFEDMDPETAQRYKAKFRIDQGRMDELFDALGRWQVSETFADNLKYLLTEREIERMREMFLPETAP